MKVKHNGVFQDVVLKGIEGKSAYQIAVDRGFEGTEAEWIASLKGESIPSGGTSNQVLIKNSDVDYDYAWVSLEDVSIIQTKADKSSSSTVTVDTTAWISDTTISGYSYKASVSIQGVTTTNNIMVSLAPTATSQQEEACALAGMQCKGQALNTVYLYARTKPTVALPIMVIILG